jgi:ribonucleoside-diphosphate reductase alpha chain
MRALDDPDALWKTTGRVDPSGDCLIKVSELWEKTAHAAWRCGDPGIQFDDIINSWHTCPYGEDGEMHAANRINASNPCSEYMFLDDTACNLASINALKFYAPENGAFDMDAYLHVVHLAQLVLEATIHWGQFPTADIARRSHLFRTTGLGLANLGALFMYMGLAYDSAEARTLGASLCSLMTGASYYASALMAEKAGPFPCFKLNKDAMKQALHNHARAASQQPDGVFENLSYEPVRVDHHLLHQMGCGHISDGLHEVWADAVRAAEMYGCRNAQVTALAPTGTIAFAMDCATTSAEPFFSHVAYKKLVGGGFMIIVNPAIPAALRRLGYTESQVAAIEGYVMRKDENGVLIDGRIEGAPHLRAEHYAVFDTASVCGTGKRVISPEGHVKMMGALAPHITGAISKTVNLPREARVEDVKKIYRLAWELGVKAITIYRDGCKASQPLNAAKPSQKEKPLTDFTYPELLDYIYTHKTVYKPHRVKPSGIRPARVHEAAINRLKLYITTSFYEDGRLGELYVSSGRQGSLTKGLLDSMSTTISEMLQYGVPPQDIAQMYRGQKYEPSGVVTGHPYIKFVDSISDLISKIIDIELGDFRYCHVKPEGYAECSADIAPPQYNATDFLPDLCPNCQSAKMIKNGTCKVCTECGTTTGCS